MTNSFCSVHKLQSSHHCIILSPLLPHILPFHHTLLSNIPSLCLLSPLISSPLSWNTCTHTYSFILHFLYFNTSVPLYSTFLVWDCTSCPAAKNGGGVYMDGFLILLHRRVLWQNSRTYQMHARISLLGQARVMWWGVMCCPRYFILCILQQVKGSLFFILVMWVHDANCSIIVTVWRKERNDGGW